MEPYFQTDSVTLYFGDCLDILPQLDIKVDLLLTDPPYSRVQSDEWDRISHRELIALLDAVFYSSSRLLSERAAVYVFCWPAFSNKLAVLMRHHFHLLDEIVWMKQTADGHRQGPAAKAELAPLRKFFPETERILFASKTDDRRYWTLCEELRTETMSPLIDYFQTAKKKSGLPSVEIQNHMAGLTGKRYVFARHTFTRSQWEFPARDQYEAAASFLPLPRSFDDLAVEYAARLRQYTEARRKYEHLRRYHAPQRCNFTDLWRYRPVMPGSRGRVHNCQKPLQMIQDMVTTSCPPGGLVLDCFAGSGTTGVAAKISGRRAVLIEKDRHCCDIIADRVAGTLL